MEPSVDTKRTSMNCPDAEMAEVRISIVSLWGRWMGSRWWSGHESEAETLASVVAILGSSMGARRGLQGATATH